MLACVWLATAPGDDVDEAGPGRVASRVPTVGADLLLIGDSLAYQLRNEFVEEASRRGYRAELGAEEGCGALRAEAIRFLGGQVYYLQPCLRLREGWADWVWRFKPKTVVLLEGWPGEGEKKLAGRWSHPCEADFDAAYAADLSDLIGRFTTAGATSVLVVVPPPAVPDLSPNYAKNWGETGPEQLEALFRERMECQNRVRAEVARSTGAVLADLREAVCPGGPCRREVDGFMLRPDGVHFQDRGAAWVSRWLLDRIGNPP